MSDETVLTLQIKNESPIELLDLTRSFEAFTEEYGRFVRHSDTDAAVSDVRLYVKDLRKGSIVVELIALSPLALPYIENAKTVIEYVKYLKTAYEFLLGKAKAKPDFEKKDLENLSAIVGPIAKDSAAQFNVSTTINGNVTLNLSMSSLDANAAQNAARREIATMTEPIRGIQNQTLLYLWQARNDTQSSTGDKGVIESLYSGPVKLVFRDESVKAKLLHSTENPFTSSYVVDVVVETINGKPTLYRVLEVHDTLERTVSELPADESG